MPRYAYKAATREGTVIEGSFEGADERAIADRLKGTGLIPLYIEPIKDSFRTRIFSGVSGGDVLAFTSELSTLLKSGLPLDRCLNILAEITQNKALEAVITELLKSIREGSSFSEALQRHPRFFSRLYINMVRAGEAGGVLESVLEKLVEFLESAKELKDSVFSAMIYPSILLVTGGISIIALLTYVLPKFTSIFGELGASLPLSTVILISFSSAFQDYWWIVTLVMIGAVVLLNRYIKLPQGRRRWDALKLRLLGNIIREIETARFCRTLGTLLKSGVPLINALNNAKDITNNTIVASSIEKLSIDVKEGKGISASLASAGTFPRLALSMIKVGEESGQLEDMLLKVASVYEKNLKQSIKRFVGFIEPAMILMMGLIIGFIVLSMLTAIFSITELPF